MVYGYEPGLTPSLDELFVQTTEEFFADIDRLSSSQRLPNALRLRNQWDGESIASFYRNLYQIYGRGVKAIGGWTPHEFTVLEHFYDLRLGSSASPTLFDQRTFAVRNFSDRQALINNVVESTNIAIDEKVILEHKNALVYGGLTTDY